MFDGNERFRVSRLNKIRGGQTFQNTFFFASHFWVATFNVFESFRRQSDGNPLNRLDDLHCISSLVSVLTRSICGASWHGPQPGVKHEFVADERPGTLPKPPVSMFIKTRAFTESEHEKSVNKGPYTPCHLDS
jgi:hypothetical protein